ncbi:MAG: type I DNA topoisomerase [Bacteroidales bacterium]|nr:type I DNA topoisomerase [Bacteroidales bacterium]
MAQNNLVIVESPAKAKTIEKFLGDNFKVMSSYGHIRDLKPKDFSIDIEKGYLPIYAIPEEKQELVNKLRKEAKKADMVWLASDEDREGEAISWHLYESLDLKPEKTKRIVFHEITKNAILNAIEHPRDIDKNLVNAQQARRILDRIVGFELSPILWKKIKPALSAGRVQSVAVKLVVEREREIHAFKAEASYRVIAVFTTPEGLEFKAELARRLKTKEEVIKLLEECSKSEFKIEDIVKKPFKKSPAPPFTTSTLQQEAARKLGFPVGLTMSIAQRLYESGHITYMRTDSVILSSLAINTSKEAISKLYGENYIKTRQFSNKTKGAQEAHEAIRPTYITNTEIEGTAQEKKLYNLIWKRTIASQMADAELERTTATISISDSKEHFQATGETIKFDGFLQVYLESADDENENENTENLLPQLKKGSLLTSNEIVATERFTQRPPRYTEASLVRKLEELGIGRPSTYAPTIQTIQQREYVAKSDKPGTERLYSELKLKAGKITEKEKKEITGADRNKLIPTDIGIVVTDFLQESFPDILDYNFTATVEKDFDDVAEGLKEWTNSIDSFYKMFHPVVKEVSAARSERKVGERVLGTDPKTGRQVSVKIGRFGPLVQIGQSTDEEKPVFASLMKEQSIETISLEEALELFKLPKSLGEYNGENISVGSGRFGPFVKMGKMYASLPKESNLMEVTLEQAIELIEDKIRKEKEKVIKRFGENDPIEVLRGRFGPYITYKGNNYKIPKGTDPESLTQEACEKIIAEAPAKTKPARKKKTK